MTDDQIRLHFGELNAAEMRLARAIVGWHERQVEDIKKWDCLKEAAVDNVMRILPELNTSPSWEDAANNVRTFIDGLKSEQAKLIERIAVLQERNVDLENNRDKMESEQAKLRASAEAMATAIGSILCPGYPKGCNKPTEFEDRMLRSALSAYQATKKP